jgi:hypothetical protein
MKNIENNELNSVPAFILFGSVESNPEMESNISYYDPISQKSIYPYGMGSDKKVTKSAKNVGSFLFPKYKNQTDDAKEK